MEICVSYAFCSASGEIAENVFASAADAEDWGSMRSRDRPGTLYMKDGDCWIPVMVFGLTDDDDSVMARGMAFLGAMGGTDYAEALENYLSCEEMPDSLKDALRAELSL